MTTALRSSLCLALATSLLGLGCSDDQVVAGDDSETSATSDSGETDPGDGDPDPGDGDPGDGDGDPGDGDGDPGDGDGDPIPPPPPPPPAYDTWVKIELADTYCSDGSQYKFFVNWHEGSDDVMVMFEPGGACWDYASCSGELGILGAANPDGIPDDHMALWGIHSPLIRRDAQNNPMRDWNMVFIPYCTGDVHTGSKTTVYESDDGMSQLTYMHVGHDNMLEVVDYLAWVFPQTDRFFAGGCSAGGAGSNVNYFFLREALAPNYGYLLNDSGPLFPNSVHSAPLHSEIRDVWGLDAVINDTPIAASLEEDLGSLNAEVADLFPEDRLAITYFVRDYNYSRYSYERFYDNITKDEVHAKWWDDTVLLMDQYDSRANLGYFIPYERFLNDSHCSTLFDFLLTDLGDMNVGDYVAHLLDDGEPLESYVDPDGSLGP